MTSHPALPKIKAIFFSHHRDQFTHEEEECPYWMILGLQAGSCHFAIKGNPWETCYPGSLILIPPDVPLRRRALERMNFYFTHFQWSVPIQQVREGLYTPHDIPRYQSTLDHWERLFFFPGNGTDGNWKDLLLFDLLNLLSFEERAKALSPNTPRDRLMERAAAILRQDIDKEKTLNDLSLALRLSPHALSRRFRAAFGVPPVAYRTRIRIQRACQLLLETRWTTDQIAQECGLNTSFYFSRVFTREMGCGPREYRKRHTV